MWDYFRQSHHRIMMISPLRCAVASCSLSASRVPGAMAAVPKPFRSVLISSSLKTRSRWLSGPDALTRKHDELSKDLFGLKNSEVKGHYRKLDHARYSRLICCNSRRAAPFRKGATSDST